MWRINIYLHLFFLLLSTGCGPAAEPDWCGTSYEQMQTLAQSMATVHPQTQVPSRDKYVTSCQRLPAKAQRCLHIEYRLEHREECHHIWSEIPVKLRKAFQRHLSSSSSP